MTAPLPLKSLLFFDAAMKHSSFTLAAQQLHVTPGAVGQQIQKLEDWLGLRLFVRSIRQVRPTAEALAYWSSIQPALARIQQSSEQLRLRQVNEVWLSMPPTLAAKWFASRMAGFLQRCPEVSLHLGTSTALIDFDQGAVDLAIRHFDGKDASLQADLLYHEEARLYCSPQYARQCALTSPDDLLRTSLLHTTLLPHWNQWLKTFSTLSAAQIQAIPSQHFDQSMLAIEAARHHQGVVLSSPILTEVEMREGSLIEPFGLSGLRLSTDKGYYLVHPQQATLRPAAAALKDWLLTLAREERARMETHPLQPTQP